MDARNVFAALPLRYLSAGPSMTSQGAEITLCNTRLRHPEAALEGWAILSMSSFEGNLRR